MLFVTILVHGATMEVSILFVFRCTSVALPQIDNRRELIALQAVEDSVRAVRSNVIGASCCLAGGTPLIGKIVLMLILQAFRH